MRQNVLAALVWIAPVVAGTLVPSFGQSIPSPGPTHPGDCVLPLPPHLQDPSGGIPAPTPIPMIPALRLPSIETPGIDSRFAAFVDPIGLLLSDLPVGGTGDDATMHSMIDQFLAEDQTPRLFQLAHQLHVQFTRRSAHIWVLDGKGLARLHDCLANDPNTLRRAFALVALSKEAGSAPSQYLEATDPYVRIAALRWLAPPAGIRESEAQRVLDRLLEDCQHAHPGVRAAAAKALGEWGFTESAVETLRNLALHDLDPGTRAAGLRALAKVRSVAVRSILLEIWRSENMQENDRNAAYAALEATGILPDEK